MKRENKERLFLFGSFLVITSLGLTSKLVKIPVKQVTTKIEYIKPKTTIQKIDNFVIYSYQIPEKYALKVDEKGEFIAYREIDKEEEKVITLEEYVLNKLKKALN